MDTSTNKQNSDFRQSIEELDDSTYQNLYNKDGHWYCKECGKLLAKSKPPFIEIIGPKGRKYTLGYYHVEVTCDCGRDNLLENKKILELVDSARYAEAVGYDREDEFRLLESDIDIYANKFKNNFFYLNQMQTRELLKKLNEKEKKIYSLLRQNDKHVAVSLIKESGLSKQTVILAKKKIEKLTQEFKG